MTEGIIFVLNEVEVLKIVLSVEAFRGLAWRVTNPDCFWGSPYVGFVFVGVHGLPLDSHLSGNLLVWDIC